MQRDHWESSTASSGTEPVREAAAPCGDASDDQWEYDSSDDSDYAESVDDCPHEADPRQRRIFWCNEMVSFFLKYIFLGPLSPKLFCSICFRI